MCGFIRHYSNVSTIHAYIYSESTVEIIYYFAFYVYLYSWANSVNKYNFEIKIKRTHTTVIALVNKTACNKKKKVLLRTQNSEEFIVYVLDKSLCSICHWINSISKHTHVRHGTNQSSTVAETYKRLMNVTRHKFNIYLKIIQWAMGLLIKKNCNLSVIFALNRKHENSCQLGTLVSD